VGGGRKSIALSVIESCVVRAPNPEAKGRKKIHHSQAAQAITPDEKKNRGGEVGGRGLDEGRVDT